MRTPLLLLGMAEVAVLYSSSYVAVLLLHGDLSNYETGLGSLAPKAILVTLMTLISFFAMGLYDFYQRVYFREIVVRIVVGLFIGGGIFVLLTTVWSTMQLQPGVGSLAALYAFILLCALRYVFYRNVDDNVFRRRTLIYGAGDRANTIADLRRKADRRGFKIVGRVPAPGDNLNLKSSVALIRDRNIDDLAAELKVDEIVIAMDDRRGNLPIRELLNCRMRGINVVDVVSFLERETSKVRVDIVNPGWLIFSPGFEAGRVRRLVKRGLDVAVSASLLALVWPVLLIIALTIKAEDGIKSTVFYGQDRVGQLGRVFRILKFRSMREDAEADGKAVWANQSDSRITRVGAVLRKYRMDELPQLINVLRGQMSLVGPRPERPEFVSSLSEQIPFYHERHTVKPGVTGWAQMRYPYGSSIEDAMEKLQYDLYYVKNNNLLLDLVILLQTVEVVFWGKGAR